MGKYGINVPKGVAVASVEEVRKAIQDVFPKENEVISLHLGNLWSQCVPCDLTDRRYLAIKSFELLIDQFLRRK